jgi:hypothetical protein
MKWRRARWFLAGFAVAVAMGAIGTLLGVRRGVMLADEEATISLPIEEDVPASAPSAPPPAGAVRAPADRPGPPARSAVGAWCRRRDGECDGPSVFLP